VADILAADRERGAATPGPTVLCFDEVTRRYGTECAVEDLSLSVREGEIVSLLGPSGCGKTTTLRLAAGLERPDEGTVAVDGRTVAGDGRFVGPEDREVGLVFQEFALFPHLTVRENVAFGLEDRSAAETAARVDELLELVGLTEYADYAPGQLSGGQKQRVALARSLAPEPAVLLLDEPLSNLDVSLREQMRREIRSILTEAGVTAVWVTHDQEEALSISDRVAVMHGGVVEQVGRPEAVFEHPTSRFVAEFLGQAGFLSGTYADGRVETAIGTLGDEMVEGLTGAYEGATVDILARPDDLTASSVDGGEGNGHIAGRRYTGPAFVYRVELDGGGVVFCQHNHDADLEVGQRVRVDLVADHTLAWYPTG